MRTHVALRIIPDGDPLVRLPHYIAGEWSMHASKKHENPFNELEVDVIVTEPDGKTRTVPAFWAGDEEWKVRLSGEQPGEYTFVTRCTDPDDDGLHGIKGSFRVQGAEDSSRLLGYGPVSVDRETGVLRHANGTPFFLLADSWWHGMTKRLRFPGEFSYLVGYRRRQGFNAVQFAVDNPCDVAPFDPRAANEGGHGWTPGFVTLNPAYWDSVDQRVLHLIDTDMVPMILGSWAYYLGFMGAAKMRRHWRNIIARYGALPVIWILCGEARLPWYGDLRAGRSGKEQTLGWTEIARYVREINSYGRPLGLHAGPAIWDRDSSYPPLSDLSLTDLYFGMGGHGAINEYQDVVDPLLEMAEYRSNYDGLALTGEAVWEGMSGGGCGPKIQRASFWGSVLTGAPGHCYGCDALWQMNRRDEPFGATAVLERACGHAPWEDAHRWPGAEHVGVGRKILERLPWWTLKPANHLVQPHIDESGGTGLHAACAKLMDGRLLVYLAKTNVRRISLNGLPHGRTYRGLWINPIDGSEVALQAPIWTDENGAAKVPQPPISQDWLLIVDPN